MRDYGKGFVPFVSGKDTAGHEYTGGDYWVNLVGCEACDGMYAVGSEKQHELTAQHKLAA